MNNKCKACGHLDSCVEWFCKEFHEISKDDFTEFANGEVITETDHETHQYARIPCPLFMQKDKS